MDKSIGSRVDNNRQLTVLAISGVSIALGIATENLIVGLAVV